MSSDRQLLEERLADAVSEFVDLLNGGSAPDSEEYLRKHPDLADALRPLLKTAVRFGRAAGAVQPVGNDSAAYNTVQGKIAAAEDKRELRKAVEAGTAKIAIEKRADVLLLLLHAVGDVFGKTMLVKLLFVTGKETNAPQAVPDYFAHYAYNYGPFDDVIYRDVDALAQLGLIDTRPARTRPPGQRQVDAFYRLTPKGKKFAAALARAQESAPGLVQELNEIARKYGRLSLDDLVRYVYETYPESTTKSLIRDEVLVKKSDPSKKQ